MELLLSFPSRMSYSEVAKVKEMQSVRTQENKIRFIIIFLDERQKTKDRSQRTKEKRQRTKDKGQKTKDKRQKTKDKRQKSKDFRL